MKISVDDTRFDPQARELLEQLAVTMPVPFCDMGIAASREMRMFDAVPSGPSLESVQDTAVPVPGGDIRVRIYRPRTDVVLPVALYLHGGGWAIGSIEAADAVCRVLADRAGCVVVSVDYRQAPEYVFPTALDDSWSALQWVVDSASEIGVDAARVVLVGDSAGGNLAAALSLRARDAGGPALCAQVLVYPSTGTDMTLSSFAEFADGPILTARDAEWFLDMYSPDRADRERWEIAPMRARSLAGLPRTAVLTAEIDPLRDDGERFAQRISDEGGPVWLTRYEGVFHGFFWLVGVLDTADRAAHDAADFLRSSFNGKDLP